MSEAAASTPLEAIVAIRRLRRAGLSMSKIAVQSGVRQRTLVRIADGEAGKERRETVAKLNQLLAEVEGR